MTMSRYPIPVRPEILVTMPGAEAVVGWDPPLQTFFGQVLDPNRPEDQPESVFWIGTAPNEYTDLLVFRTAMAPWADVHAQTLARLADDRASSPPPTLLQQQLGALGQEPAPTEGDKAAAVERVLRLKVAALEAELALVHTHLAALAPPPPQPMTQEAYRAAGGGCCPVCQSAEIEARTNVEMEEPTLGLASQRLRCDDCDTTWMNYYRLGGYIRDGEGGGEDWEAFDQTEIVEREEE
jgi:hypothetical protein